MLTPQLIDALLAPVGEDAPCGSDLEYDPAFTALQTAAQGKPEQQFGAKVIAAVEPEWSTVAEQAQALLRRTKDLRPAVLLVRAATRVQGLQGLLLGLQLLTGLFDRYWEQLHPRLDPDDGNDPMMRINVLAPLNAEAMLPRDLYEAQVGVAPSLGAVRVREIAATHGVLTPSADTPSQTQVLGALAEIQAAQPEFARTLTALAPGLAALQRAVDQHSGQDGLLDIGRLLPVGKLLAQIGNSFGHHSPPDEAAAAGAEESAAAENALADAGPPPPAAAVAMPRGDGIRNRQEALRMLDCVIAYFEQAEPGNPAPLLLSRAKQLIGVSFFDIMANLAPNALDTIESVIGRRPSSE